MLRFFPAKPLIFVASIAASSVSHAQSSEPGGAGTIISGFAAWQAARVERIILDNSLRSIANDPYIERYFQDTTANIKTYQTLSAKALLPLVQESIQADVKTFSGLVAACIPYNMNQWLDTRTDDEHRMEWLAALNKGLSQIADLSKNNQYTIKKFVLEVCPGIDDLTDNSELKKLRDRLKNLISFYEPQKTNAENPDPKTLSPYHRKRLSAYSSDYASQTDSRILGISDSVYNSMSALETTTKTKENISDAPSASNQNSINKKTLANTIETLFEFLPLLEKINDKNLTYTIRVHYFLTALDRFAALSEADYPQFSKLQRTALFFAGLVDAAESGDAQAVATVLDVYIDTKSAYEHKRQPGGLLWASYYAPKYDTEKQTTTLGIANKQGFVSLDLYLSSYYGYGLSQIGDEEQPNEASNQARFFGPVGFELKLASFTKGVISLNYAPIDVGAYITNELSDKDYTASFDDILAPSYFLSFSLKSAPFALIAGRQHNINLTDAIEADGNFVAITFDLPILRLL